MDEFMTKFTNLIWHVPYIRVEKAKVHRFMKCLPLVYKERIEFDNPRSMDDAVRKARLCYQQFRNQNEDSIAWKNKDKHKMRMNVKRQRPAYLKKFGKDH